MTWGGLASLPGQLNAWGGWRRRGILFLAGAITTLALPPFNIWPVAFLTLPFIVWMLEGVTRRRQAFGIGWWFAFGYFCAGWYWISNALLVFSTDLWWMIPFALVGLPLVMAVYYGLATLIVDSVAGRATGQRLGRCLLLVVGFAGMDMLRGVLFTGFPWNTFGYLWSGVPALSQAASLIGVYGMGVLVLLSGFLISMIATEGTDNAHAQGRARRRFSLVIVVALPALVFAGGTIRLSLAPDLTQQQADPALPGLRMVQANIPQTEKWGRDFRLRNFQTFLRLSSADRPDWVSTVIWPETSAAFFIEETPDLRTAAGAFAAPTGGYLITGAPRRVQDPLTLYNALLALNDQGDVKARYDKAHLVPFGEYVPLGDYLPFGKVTIGAVDYSPGPGPRTLTLPGLPPFSPLICYEIIFPGQVIDSNHRPEWILNITNDAWYGHSTGPYQHVQHTRLRAIEEGLPLVRSASTGVSVAYDGYGRELARIGLDSSGVRDFRLPPPLAETLFASYGNIIALFLITISAIAGMMAIRR
ncbi:apolipoprotein N-acyltransferase [Hwanghaeella sp. LZ110]|uniref:apolipoprotein N-acyltransferase n=1 Tax=Hwanghaeella sp. LZ110 TaxID=3402810 RepID=UPI003B682C90